MRTDPSLPPVFTQAQANRAGMSRHQTANRVSSGAWRRLRRGVFTLGRRWEAASPEERGVLLAAAALLGRSGAGPCAVSHVSAAAVHGLPLPAALLSRAWITVPPGPATRTRRTRTLVQEVAALPAGETCLVRGIRVTTPARTAADCLRHLGMPDAVAVADAALNQRLLSSEELARAVHDQMSWPLSVAARTALALVDGRRESALESRAGVSMHLHGLPPPLCQVEIRDRRGRLVARVDFLWPEAGVVGEADGRTKYRGADAPYVIEAEKDRQAALEALGLVVVRWGSRHLEGDPPPFVTRLRTALAPSRRRRFLGSFTQVALPCTR